MIETLIVCIIAGLGAGIGTGFAGLSAAAVISPMLVTFLGFDSYEAVGIALASDVLASAISAYTYGKNKNLDIKNGLVMMVTVLLFTMIGSFVASLVPGTAMGNLSVLMTFLLGIRFILWPVMTTKDLLASKSPRLQAAEALIGGIVIGFICGFIGAGGGMMMLFVLTTILGYELKTAVGTSVFIMTFTGAVSHFSIGGLPDPFAFFVCVVATLAGAQVTAKIANRSDPKTLNRMTGIVLTALGAVMIAVQL